MTIHYLPLSDTEANLMAQILNAQAANKPWHCHDSRFTALLRSLRVRGLLEKLPGKTKSAPARWRVTAHGLRHPALQPEGSVHAQLSAAASTRYATVQPEATP